MHGLLQTPAYLRAVYEAGGGQIDDGTIQRKIKLRQERQQGLTTRKPPLRVTAIFGAGVLARQLGDKAVMAEQVDRLCAG